MALAHPPMDEKTADEGVVAASGGIGAERVVAWANGMMEMNTWTLALAIACVALVPKASSGQTSHDKTVKQCSASPHVVGACFTLHGRLSFSNGTPDCRLWRIGTKRILGVLDPSNTQERNEGPRLPYGIACFPGDNTYADFTVCPMTKERPGEMQMVCVESASHVVTVVWADVCDLLRIPDLYSGMQINVHGILSRTNASVMTNNGCSGSISFVAAPSLHNDDNYRRVRERLKEHDSVTVDVKGRLVSPSQPRLVIESILEIEDTPTK